MAMNFARIWMAKVGRKAVLCLFDGSNELDLTIIEEGVTRASARLFCVRRWGLRYPISRLVGQPQCCFQTLTSLDHVFDIYLRDCLTTMKRNMLG